jgi:hypothetical protein
MKLNVSVFFGMKYVQASKENVKCTTELQKKRIVKLGTQM